MLMALKATQVPSSHIYDCSWHSQVHTGVALQGGPTVKHGVKHALWSMAWLTGHSRACKQATCNVDELEMPKEVWSTETVNSQWEMDLEKEGAGLQICVALNKCLGRWHMVLDATQLFLTG